MRISSTIAVLAAMFILGVSAAGETTSTDGNGATNEELENQIDNYTHQPGFPSQELEMGAYMACTQGEERQRLLCVMDWLDDDAKEHNMPLPPWTKQVSRNAS